MKNDIFIQEGIIIPAHELEITTSRAGGPGGQHVNRTSSRITIRWNIKSSQALDDALKARILQKLSSQITQEGDLIIHNSETKSQIQNKRLAFELLAEKIRKALIIPKKRRPTKITKSAQEKRKNEKKQRSDIKRMRRKIDE